MRNAPAVSKKVNLAPISATNPNGGYAIMMGSCLNVVDSKALRSSVGASILWSSPLGPIRFDYAFALSKAKNQTFADGTVGGGDVTQAFRFSASQGMCPAQDAVRAVAAINSLRTVAGRRRRASSASRNSGISPRRVTSRRRENSGMSAPGLRASAIAAAGVALLAFSVKAQGTTDAVLDDLGAMLQQAYENKKLMNPRIADGTPIDHLFEVARASGALGGKICGAGGGGWSRAAIRAWTRSSASQGQPVGVT